MQTCKQPTSNAALAVDRLKPFDYVINSLRTNFPVSFAVSEFHEYPFSKAGLTFKNRNKKRKNRCTRYSYVDLFGNTLYQPFFFFSSSPPLLTSSFDNFCCHLQRSGELKLLEKFVLYRIADARTATFLYRNKCASYPFRVFRLL